MAKEYSLSFFLSFFLSFILALLPRTGVLRAEPNYIYKKVQAAAGTPSDTYWTNMWHLRQVQANLAWANTTGSSLVKVCIIDR